MARTTQPRHIYRAGACAGAAAAGLAVIAGCASTRLDAQWLDPQPAPNFLRGARVLVACDAYEPVITQICQDHLSAEVVARGGTSIVAPDTTNAVPGRPVGAGQYLPAARGAGAKAVMSATIWPSAASVSPGLSVGIGGLGGGWHSGVGVGVSAPIGGGQVTTGYSANVRVIDSASGRLLWTAQASARPSSDLDAQLVTLARALFGAADKAQLF